MAILLGACNAKAPDAAPAVPTHDKAAPSRTAGAQAPSTRQDVQNMPDDHQNASATRPPSPDSVLYFIFQKDGDGATSYRVENGSWASYWYGYPFELDGKHYFTGFAYQTPYKFDDDDDDAAPAADARVTLAEATYVQAAPGSEKPWAFLGATRHVGEFGGYEKGNEIDTARQPQSLRTPSGKLLLAVPTWYLSSGTRVSSVDLFLFNPGELKGVDDTRWTYLGNIATGEDNGAACDEGSGPVPCAKSSGTVEFIARDGDDLPLVRVAMEGTAVAEAGKTRTLGATDAVEYRYDAGSKQYQQ
jgi:hypothetical protein